MFGSIKTAQVRRWIRWWHHFSSDLGSHVCAEQLFECGKNCVYVEEYEGFSSEQPTNVPNSDLCCGCRLHWTITTQVHSETMTRTCSTAFDHVWPQPGDEVILASVCNWTQWYWHETMSKACALLLEWFLVALSHGKVLFSGECAVYCSSLSWNVFWC